MEAISKIASGNVAEDYLFTQILRDYGKNNNLGDIVKVNSLNVITHRNRCPLGDAAINQLLRWKKQGNAVDQIFPEFKYEYKPLIEYMAMTFLSRLKVLIKERQKYSFVEMINDIKSIPGILEIIRDKDVSDVINGNASWSHENKK